MVVENLQGHIKVFLKQKAQKTFKRFYLNEFFIDNFYRNYF